LTNAQDTGKAHSYGSDTNDIERHSTAGSVIARDWVVRDGARICDPPMTWSVDSWIDPPSGNTTYGFQNTPAPGYDFNIYDPSMGMGSIQGLANAPEFGQSLIPSYDPWDFQVNSTFSVPEFASSFAFNENHQVGTFMPVQPVDIGFQPLPVTGLLPDPVLYTQAHICAFCNRSFKRPSDLVRHGNTVHLNMKGHLCPIAGCSKSGGRGYSRADKVTEHLWRKHGDLGYTKA